MSAGCFCFERIEEKKVFAAPFGPRYPLQVLTLLRFVPGFPLLSLAGLGAGLTLFISE